jgi:iron(III) transport system permease protein
MKGDEHLSSSLLSGPVRVFTIKRTGILVCALVVFSPLCALIVESINSLANGNSDWLLLAIPTGRRLMLLLHSIGLAAAVATGGMILGTLTALALWRWDTGARSYLRWLVLITAALPAYIHALAWTASVNAINPGLERLGMPTIPLEGWTGSWWVHLMALLPIAVGLALVGLKSIEPRLVEAARMARSDTYSLFRVILPLAMPSLLAAGGLLFLLSLLDYSVPSLFSVNVYSLEIFAEFSASNQPTRAFLLSLPLLVIAVAVITVSFSTLKKAAQSPALRAGTWQVKPAWPAWLVILQSAAVIVLAVQIILPLISLIISAGTWNNLTAAVGAAGQEIGFTFQTALATVICCIPLALAAAAGIDKSGKRRGLWWLLVTAPLAIPPPLTGIGLISIWNHPFLLDIYGSGAMPVLAGLARFTPLAVIVLTAQFSRIDPLLIDAARVIQKSRWQELRRIRVPLLLPGLLAATGICFVLTAGELGATLLVAPPGQATLTMRIYNFLHYGESSTVAGLCLMMVLILLIAGFLAAASLLRWSNILPQSIMKRK